MSDVGGSEKPVILLSFFCYYIMYYFDIIFYSP